MEEGELGVAVFVFWKSLAPGVGKVVGIDGDVIDAGGEAVVDGVGDEGAVVQGDERLGEDVGERLEAGAETGAEDEGFAHGGVSS